MIEITRKKYEKIFRRLHKSNGHLKFLTECQKRSLLPNFTYISAQTVRTLNLKKSEIHKYRRNQLQQKLDDQILINQNLNFELNHTQSLLSTLIHHISLQTILTNIKRKIYNKESKHDLRRLKKLDF